MNMIPYIIAWLILGVCAVYVVDDQKIRGCWSWRYALLMLVIALSGGLAYGTIVLAWAYDEVSNLITTFKWMVNHETDNLRLGTHGTAEEQTRLHSQPSP